MANFDVVDGLQLGEELGNSVTTFDVVAALCIPAEPPPPDAPFDEDYCALALARLRQQFKDKPKLADLICAIADRGTELGQELVNIKEFRSLDDAFGQQLDELGRLYNEFRSGETDAAYRSRLKAMALLVSSKGTGNDLQDILILLDAGFDISAIEYYSHFPACVLMTVDVPSGGQLLGERHARIMKRAVDAGVCFQLQFEEQDETLFVWDNDPGAGWAEETDPVGTGGIWSEAV